ncbi:hypothetical protein [Allopontixanthobacter sediminis]|uniref:Uncharacterized protein n=1 Tax=Allopontixanthobacter sediminis TaxID=1689985 RepID=A0A845B3E1_9SPHN|nr:hypothetical protein [Allopontixanthobacter sediminis]MXP45771.1 hypothetical protein [Allopontixanthobacter sediminis]
MTEAGLKFAKQTKAFQVGYALIYVETVDSCPKTKGKDLVTQLRDLVKWGSTE